MFVLLTTLNGDVYVLHADSLFPLSVLLHQHIQQVVLLNARTLSDRPTLFLLQDTISSSSSSSQSIDMEMESEMNDNSSSQSVVAAALTFGTLTLLPATEITASSLLLPSSCSCSCSSISLLAVLPNPSSYTLRIWTLSSATTSQQFLSLIHARRYNEAFQMAEQEGFDKTVIYRQKLRELIQPWKERMRSMNGVNRSQFRLKIMDELKPKQASDDDNDYDNDTLEKEERTENWLEAPSVDCTDLIALLEQSNPLLVFYVLSCDSIPSAYTYETLLQYAIQRYHRLSSSSSSTISSTSTTTSTTTTMISQWPETTIHQFAYQLQEYLHRWELFRSGSRLLQRCSIQVWLFAQHTSLVDLQEHLLLRGDVCTLQLLWQLYGQQASPQAEAMRKGVMQAFTLGVMRQQQQGQALQDGLLEWMEHWVLCWDGRESELERGQYAHDIPCIDTTTKNGGKDGLQRVQMLTEWVCSYVESQLQRLSEDEPREKHITGILLRNLLHLVELVERYPLSIHSTQDQVLTAQVLKLSSYLREYITITTIHHVQIPLSPSADLPSKEDIVLRLLDNLQNPSLLRCEIDLHVKPFCQSHNICLENILSYYLRAEFEKANELDMRRIRVIWEEIQQGDLRVDALHGLTLRSPPYSEELCDLVKECAKRVCDNEKDE